MKKSAILLLVIFFGSLLFAQNTDEQKYLLTTTNQSFGLATLSILDPYLSPSVYSGIGIKYGDENSQFFSPENINISWQNKMNLETGLSFNPASTNYMFYFGANYGWGMSYHFRLQKGLQVLAGGLCDLDFGLKMIGRNVNNPVNLDLATNLNLTGAVLYDIPLRRKTLRLQLALQTPVLGCMFVPVGGASYYEIFELGNFTNTFHVSSLINKRGLSGAFTVDVPFNRSVWRVGLNFMTLKYAANDMVFQRNEFGLSIGTTFDVATFAGRKNKAPKNFISANE